MKKTIVLLTIVLAIIAAPVFAETGFSGSVEYKFATDFDEGQAGYKQDTGNETAISLDGAVGEFTTVSVGIEADGNSSASATIMTLSQDVTGALGVDGPVSFSYKLGKQTYSPADYSGVAGYKDAGADAKIGQSWGQRDTVLGYDILTDNPTVSFDGFTTNSMMGFVATLGLMDKIYIDVAAYPASYFEKTASPQNGYAQDDTYAEFGVNAYGTFGPVQASVYFVGSPMTDLKDQYGDAIDENGKMIGANFSYVADALSVGFLWETDLENEYAAYYAPNVDGGSDLTIPPTSVKTIMNTEIGVAAQYTIGALTPGVAFATSFYEDSDFASSSKLGVNLTFAATEAVNLTAAFNTPFGLSDKQKDLYEMEFVDVLGYEVGVDATLDGVTYMIGWTKDSEFAGYDAEFAKKEGGALISDPTNNFMLSTGNMYVKVKASF